MAAENPNIKHIDVQGIALDVDMAKLNDPRFTYVIGKLTDETLNDVEKLPWVNRWFDTLLGANAYKVMCEVADNNGGTLTAEQWNDFFGDVLEAVNAKN
jgi:hypothetical protein